MYHPPLVSFIPHLMYHASHVSFISCITDSPATFFSILYIILSVMFYLCHVSSISCIIHASFISCIIHLMYHSSVYHLSHVLSMYHPSHASSMYHPSKHPTGANKTCIQYSVNGLSDFSSMHSHMIVKHALSYDCQTWTIRSNMDYQMIVIHVLSDDCQTSSLKWLSNMDSKPAIKAQHTWREVLKGMFGITRRARVRSIKMWQEVRIMFKILNV